ncbi:MAG: PA14 domain-containing protein, partial [Kiritimatiellia bacterium]
MQLGKTLGLIVLLGLLYAAGCGKKAPPPPGVPAPATPTVESGTSQTSQPIVVVQPTNAPPVEPPPEVEVVDEAFEAAVQKVVALEQDADFVAAFQQCQTLKETYRLKVQQKKLVKLSLRIISEKKASGDLLVALNNLMSGKEENTLVAEQKLSEERETGGILLRKALRTETDERALPVARLLTDMRDISALPVFTAQLATRKAPQLIESLADGVKIMISGLGTNEIAAFYQLMLSDTNFAHSRSVSVLETVLRKRSGNDAAQFNQLVGAVDGYENLRAYIEKALLATDTNKIAWACDFGGTLIGSLNAVTGQYYADPAFQSLVTQRVDTVIVLGNRQFPLEDRRFNEVSARWSARLEIPRAGAYTFYVNAVTRGVVSVNGQSVVVSQNGVETNATVKLPAGQIPFQVDYICQQSEHASGLQVAWSGSNMPKQVVSSASLRISPWYDAVLSLRPAIRQLVSTNFAEARAAKALLAWSGETGNIFLRDAFQHEPAPVALRAAELLAERRDRRSPALLIARIEQQPDSPLLPALTTILCDLAPLLDPQQIQHLYQAMPQDADAAMVPQAAALCAVLNRVCENDKDRFNNTVQDPKGYDLLSRYVQRAMISSNDAAVVRACEFGAPFAPVLNGLRGQYFFGQQFDEPALERLESRLDLNERYNPNPLPENRRGDSSLRWTGFLRIDTAAIYTFSSRSVGNSVLFIDDRPVVNNWNWEERSGAPVTLVPGWHRLKAEGTVFEMSWSRTNFEKQVIAGNVFRSPMWRSALLALPPAVDNLTSTNLATRRAAAATLAQAQELAAVFLRNAIRHKADPVAKAAAAVLTERNDAPAAALLIERIRKTQDSTIVPDLLENLRSLAANIPPDLIPPLCEAIGKDSRMIPEASLLCIVLDRLCSGKVEEFNKLAKDPKAHEQLKLYVTQACMSTNDAVVMRAAQFGAPFVAPSPGLRGRYYLGAFFDELTRDRLDFNASIPERSYPWPSNQMRNVSVRWDGLLNVDRAGDYIFDLNSGSWQGLSIDGVPVQFQGEWNRRINKVAVSAGVHRISMTLQNGNDGGIGGQLDWTGPGFGRRIIGPEALCTPLWPDALARLPGAINNLSSTNWAEVRTAKAVLLQAGEAGRIFLRNAIRYKPDPVAKVAAAILADQYDVPAAALLIERIRKTPDSIIAPDLLENLRNVAEFIPTELVPVLCKAVWNDKDIQMSPEADILCMLLDRTCGGRGEDFNKLAKDPKAYDLLKAYVARACTSQDDAIVQRAGQFGAPFVADAPGLCGNYYQGAQWDELATERLATSVNQPRRQYPVADAWQTDLSARWTGALLINQPGPYTLCVQRGQSQVQLWLDGKILPMQQVPRDDALYSNTVVLAKGTHLLRLELQGGGEWNQLALLWNGPGISRQVIPADALRTPLWSSELVKLPGAINSLVSTNWAESRAARATLLQAGPAGRNFLWNAIRYKPDPVAKVAAQMLAEQKDALTAPLLVERIRKSPEAAIVPDLLENLRELAEFIPADLVPPLLVAVRNDKEVRMIPEASLLCLVLDRTCNGKAEEFNKLVNDPKGYAQLKAYVAQACCANNDAIVLLAGQFGAPFVADAPGLRGRYYLGTEFDSLALDQLDAAVNLPNGWAVFPGKRTRDVSARWTGTLLVKQPGVHVLALQYYQSKSRLWIDGNPVVFPGPDTRNQTNVVTLSEGPHRIRVDYQFGQSDYNELRLLWSKPGNNKLDFISAEALRTPLSSSELAKLPPAIDALTSTNVPEMRAARSALLRMGEPGALFLRNAIRHKPDSVAKEAAMLLAAQSDAPGVPLIIERIRKAPDAAIVPDLLESLRELAGQLTPDLLPPLYEAVKKDTEARMIPEASLLCIALDRTCGGRAEEFNKLVKDPKGYAQLKAYVAQACSANNDAIVLRAGQFGSPFVADAPGLRGRYYLGTEFDSLALDQLDAAVNLPQGWSVFPGKRTRDVSARWTGTLLVKPAGVHVLALQYCQSQSRIWIDGNPVVFPGTDARSQTNVMTLSEGPHRIRVDYQYGQADWNELRLMWSKPGNNKLDFISAEALRTPLSSNELAKLPPAIDALISTNVPEVRAARSTLLRMGEPGALFLRNAIRHKPDSVAKEAAMLLAAQSDA